MKMKNLMRAAFLAPLLAALTLFSAPTFTQTAGWEFPTSSSVTVGAGDNGKVLASDNVPGASVTVTLPNPATVGAGWQMGFSNGGGKGIILNAPISTFILTGQKTVTSYSSPSNTNYEYFSIISDGTNFRLVANTPTTGLFNGTETAATKGWTYLFSTGYGATNADNGGILSSQFTGGTTTITLPSTGLIPNGWEVDLYPAGGNPIVVVPNGVSGGTLIDPIGASVSSYQMISGFWRVLFDGSSFRLTGQVADQVRLTSINTSITSADNDTIIGVTGTSPVTVTAPAASSLSPGFTVTISNLMISPLNGGRGVKISAPGINLANNNWLYPGPHNQSVTLTVVNNTWVPTGYTSRWTVPNIGQSGVTYTINPASGDDLNDGLADGAGNAFLTPQHCFDVLLGGLDGGNADPTIVCKMAAGSTDSTGIHYAPHDSLGLNGGAAVQFDCNGSTLHAGGTGAVIQLYFSAILQLVNSNNTTPCLLDNTTAGGVVSAGSGATGGTLYIMGGGAGITFGALCNGCNHMQVSSGGTILIQTSYNIQTGGAGSYHIITGPEGNVQFGAIHPKLLNDVTFADVTIQSGGTIDASQASINYNGHNLNAQQFSLSANAFLYGKSTFTATCCGTTNGVDDPFTGFTSTLSCGTGTLTSASAVGNYYLLHQVMHINYDITLTSVGSCASSLSASLPLSFGALSSWVIVGTDLSTGKSVKGLISNGSGNSVFTYYDGTLPISNGVHIQASGIYQAVAQ